MDVKTQPDRTRDLSQPLDRLGPDETLKAESDYLRGTIKQSLADEVTAAVAATDAKLMKFFGIYQQDDRDIRDERRRQKLEAAFSFMMRVRLPGGVCSPSQWLKLDALGRAYGGDTLRLTTRQTFQLHHVMKQDLRAAIQGLRDVLLDTKAACGDDTRGVMCTVNPSLSKLHAQVYALAKQASDHATHKTGAYQEIWYGAERQDTDGPEEPFYGRTYMPRKFKIGFAIPPSNDIDVYSQDLGFITIARRGKLKGFNVAIGGGLGRTDQAPKTYPRLASVIGYVDADKLIPTIDAVMSVQRDYGDRLDRMHARFKYTIDEKGLDWIKAEIERRLGFAFEPAQDYHFTSNGDPLGWTKGEDGRDHCTLFIQNGRILNTPDRPMMDGLRAIARVHKGMFRITPNQNLDYFRNRSRGPASHRGADEGIRPRRVRDSQWIAPQLDGLRRFSDLRPGDGRERALSSGSRYQDRGHPRRPWFEGRPDHHTHDRMPEWLCASLYRRDRPDRAGARKVQPLSRRWFPRAAPQQDVSRERRGERDPRSARCHAWPLCP